MYTYHDPSLTNSLLAGDVTVQHVEKLLLLLVDLKIDARLADFCQLGPELDNQFLEQLEDSVLDLLRLQVILLLLSEVLFQPLDDFLLVLLLVLQHLDFLPKLFYVCFGST